MSFHRDTPTQHECERVTVLTCKPGFSGSKTFRQRTDSPGVWDKVSDYSAGALFTAREPAIEGLRDLGNLVDEIRRDPRSFFVRGALTPEAREQAEIYRRGPTRADRSLLDVPCSWVPIDIDDYRLPPGIDFLQNPEAAIEAAIRDRLPAEFQNVVAFWQLSNSCGIARNILKVHIFFWLAKPLTCAQLRKLLKKGAPDIDWRAIKAAQPVWIADPVLKNGHDWLPRRTGWLLGERCVVDLEPPAENESHGDYELSETAATTQGVLGALARLGDGHGLGGFHDPLTTAIMRYALDCCATNTRADAAFFQTVRQAIDDAPKSAARDNVERYKSDHYLTSSLAGAFRLAGEWNEQRAHNTPPLPGGEDDYGHARVLPPEPDDDTDAGLRLPGPPDGPLLLAGSDDDANAVWQATGHETWGGSFERHKPPGGRRVVVCRRDDKPWSPPDRALRKTVDAWRAEGVDVVVATPWLSRRGDGSTFSQAAQESGPEAVRAQVEAVLFPRFTPPRRLGRDEGRDAVHEVVRKFGVTARQRLAEEDKTRAELVTRYAPITAAELAAAKDKREKARIERAAEERIENAVVAAMPPLPVQAMKVTVAVGKTTAARETAAKMLVELRRANDPRPVVLAVPRHNLGDEQVEKFQKIEAVHEAGLTSAVWRGREAADPNAPGQPMCRNLDAVRDAESVGASVQSSVCRRVIDGAELTCPHFHECGYQKQRQREGVDFWVVAHQLLFMEPPAVMGKPAMRLIDESFWAAGLKGCDDLHPIILTIESLNDSLEDETDVLPLSLILAHQKLREMLAKEPDGPVRRKVFIDAGLTSEAAANFRKMEWKRKIVPDMNPGQTATERRAAVEAAAFNRVVPRLAMLWDAAEGVLASKSAEASGWAELITLDTQDGPVRALRLTGRRRVHPGWDAPTLISDAILNVDLVRPFFSHVQQVADVVVDAPHQTIIQVDDCSFSKRRLLVGDHTDEKEANRRDRNLRDLHAVVSAAGRTAQGRVLAVMQKDVEDAIIKRGMLPGCLETGHHNAVAGLDRWGPDEHGEGGIVRLVVAGRTSPPPYAVERLRGALTGISPTRLPAGGWYEKRTIWREMRNGAPPQAEADWHPDYLCESIRFAICEGELIQIVGRARGVNRTSQNPVEVWLLTSTVLPLPVDVTLHLEDLEPTPGALMLAGGAVSYDNPTDAATAYPGLWKTRNAAKLAFTRAAPTHDRRLGSSPYKTLLYGFDPNLRSYAYQKAGAGGRPVTATVDVSLVPDPPAAIAAALDNPLTFCRSQEPPVSDPQNPASAPPEPIAALRTIPPPSQILCVPAPSAPPPLPGQRFWWPTLLQDGKKPSVDDETFFMSEGFWTWEDWQEEEPSSNETKD